MAITVIAQNGFPSPRVLGKIVPASYIFGGKVKSSEDNTIDKNIGAGTIVTGQK